MSIRLRTACFALGLAGAVLALAGPPSVAGPAAPGPAILVAAAGDIACDPELDIPDGSCRDAATARMIDRRDPSAVLALGDLQYEDGALDKYLLGYDQTWGSFKASTRPAIGNHEYRTADAQGYHDYFRASAGGQDGYYAFDAGGWRLYSINAECAHIGCKAEREWMRADVLAHPRSCQLMFMHKPLYSSGLHDESSPRRFWRVGYRHRFELALAGHDHLYERFAPMDHRGNVVKDGIRSFIVGTGGKSLHSLGTVAKGSRVRFTEDFGILLLTLRPGSYDWRFRTIGGVTVDTGTGVCH